LVALKNRRTTPPATSLVRACPALTVLLVDELRQSALSMPTLPAKWPITLSPWCNRAAGRRRLLPGPCARRVESGHPGTPEARAGRPSTGASPAEPPTLGSGSPNRPERVPAHYEVGRAVGEHQQGIRIFLEQIEKKSLNEVLCISGRIAAMTQEGIEWRPIGFAKSGKRPLSRFGRLGLPRTQDKSPMRRLKRGTALLEGSWNRFHQQVVST
jgi:hypothetical protein